jgi:hypothetical protein
LQQPQLTDRQFVGRAVAALAEIERRGGRKLPKDEARNQPVSRIIATLLEFFFLMAVCWGFAGGIAGAEN